MSEQRDEGIPPMDFGPSGMFITDNSGWSVQIAGLSQEQSARVFALQQARIILDRDDETDTVRISENAQREWTKPAPAPEVMDIFNLALYIIDGQDPWETVKVERPLFRVAAVEDTGGPDEELPGFD